jgi:thiol-disulfide isomerase/thioredoxin
MIIDPATHLPRAIELAADPAGFGDKVPGSSAAQEVRIGWRSGPISTDAPDPSAFETKPPRGYSQVEAVQVPPEKRAADAGKPSATHPLLGQPAPEFRFEILESADKTRPIDKDALKGRVVLLDFWTPYCGPCVQRLPELDGLMAAYKKADDVAIIALDVEHWGDERAALRRRILTIFKQTGVDPISKGPVGLVGIDTKDEIRPLFQVQGVPSVMILDKEGIVRFYRVGAVDVGELNTVIDRLR